MNCVYCSFFVPDQHMCECTCHHTEWDWDCENVPMWNNPINRMCDVSVYLKADDGYKCSQCGYVEANVSDAKVYRFCPSCGCRIDHAIEIELEETRSLVANKQE